jgi:hypothetical protein
MDPLKTMWKYADQARFSQWVSPYETVYLSEGSNPTFGQFTLSKYSNLITWFYDLFQIKTIGFIFPGVFVIGILIVIFAVRLRSAPPSTSQTVLIPIAILLVVSALFSLTFNQEVSMIRYFIFTTPPMIVLGIALWFNFFQFATTPQIRSVISDQVIAVLMVCAVLVNMILVGGDLYFPSKEASFLLGQVSYSDAYLLRGQGWPELVAARRMVGLDARILTLDPLEGAAPGRPIETEVDYNYKEWHVMVFGTAEEAEAALKREGINYFIIDTKLGPQLGGLPHSDLFDPQKLNDRFDVIMNKNSTYLLTWKGSGKSIGVIPQKAIDTWAEFVAKDYPELYERIKLYYQRNNGAAYPVYTDPTLPAVPGWQ